MKLENLSTPGLLMLWAVSFQLLLGISSSGLKGPFVFDDYIGIAQNRDLQDPVEIMRIFGDHNSSVEFDRRPVSAAVMLVNYQLTGPNPTSFRVLNVFLHWVIAGLAFIVIRKLARHFNCRDPQTLAIISSVLWMVHPLVSSTVSYCYQRIEMLMVFFFLLALLALLRSRTSGRPLRWLVLAVISAIFSALSKETGLRISGIIIQTYFIKLDSTVFIFET